MEAQMQDHSDNLAICAKEHSRSRSPSRRNKWMNWKEQRNNEMRWFFLNNFISRSSPPHQSQVFFIPSVYRPHPLNDRFWKRFFMSFQFRSDLDLSVGSPSYWNFSSKWYRIWCTWIVLFKCLLLAKNPTSTMVGHRVIQISCVFCAFPML